MKRNKAFALIFIYALGLLLMLTGWLMRSDYASRASFPVNIESYNSNVTYILEPARYKVLCQLKTWIHNDGGEYYSADSEAYYSLLVDDTTVIATKVPKVVIDFFEKGRGITLRGKLTELPANLHSVQKMKLSEAGYTEYPVSPLSFNYVGYTSKQGLLFIAIGLFTILFGFTIDLSSRKRN